MNRINESGLKTYHSDPVRHDHKGTKTMINLELSHKHEETFAQVMMLAEHMMRPYSRKYDKEEHTYPVEMEEVNKLKFERKTLRNLTKV